MRLNLFKTTIPFKMVLLGVCIPLGFAPFSFPVIIWISLLFFFMHLEKNSNSKFSVGYYLGIGLNLFGTSWIYVSIHEYGHLHPILSAFLTLLFILFISIFYGLISLVYQHLRIFCHQSLKPLLFGACWCLGEWVKSHCFGGFPWLNLGFSALNTPFAPLLPWLGIYAPSFLMCVSLGYFGLAIQGMALERLNGLLGLALFLTPQALHLPQNSLDNSNMNVSVIQGNVQSQDKWDEQLFWQQFYDYISSIRQNLAPHQLIILPEAAIIVPRAYVQHELTQLDTLAQNTHSAILFGVPETTGNENEYFNSMMGLGHAKGQYFKQQLVPFGESIPHRLIPMMRWLGLPIINTVPGRAYQPPIQVFGQPIATLICYELGYPEHLRHQLPQGRWIVSMSDDGWFGHSFALHQHLQMAQVLSYMAQRDQIFVNNNGLSSFIDHQGRIQAQLPAWKKQVLSGHIKSHQTITPWMNWGDTPILLSCLFILSFAILNYSLKILRLSHLGEIPLT